MKIDFSDRQLDITQMAATCNGKSKLRVTDRKSVWEKFATQTRNMLMTFADKILELYYLNVGFDLHKNCFTPTVGL